MGKEKKKKMCTLKKAMPNPSTNIVEDSLRQGLCKMIMDSTLFSPFLLKNQNKHCLYEECDE